MFNNQFKQIAIKAATMLLGVSLLAGCTPATTTTTTAGTTASGTIAATTTAGTTGGATTAAQTTAAATTAANDSLAKIKAAGVIVMGTSPDYPPNEFYVLDANNQKQIVGSDIMLGQAIADKIGVKLEIKPTDFQGVLSNIQAAQVDMAIAGFSYTEGRKSAMQYSDGYATESEVGWQGILMSKTNAAKYTSLDQIKAAKLKFGAQSGSVQQEMAAKLTDPMSLKIMGTLDALALSLNAGDIDALVISTDNATNMLKTFSDLMILPKETFNLDPENLYAQNVVAFPLGDQHKSLIEVANEVIKAAKADGSMEKWRAEALELAKKAVE